MIKKHFKKLVSLALAAVMVMGMSVTAFASETSPYEETASFNMAEYLKKNPVSSKSEFISVIMKYGNDTAIKSLDETTATTRMATQEADFSYIINEAEQMIYVKTLSVGEETLSPARATTYQNSATSTYEGYSWVGVHVFTVTTKGTFNYDKSSYCNNIKSEGYFNPAFLSLWDASTWISTGNYSKAKAYVDTYGTANLNLSIAEILGLTFNVQSVNYNLELTCDKYGNFDSSWTYDQP